MNKTKNPRYTTPAGIAQYPYLNKPDTKFNPDGDYKVNLELPIEEAQQLIAKLDELHEAAKAKAKKENPGKKIKDGSPGYDINEETGAVTFKFKTKAKITTKNGDSFAQKVAIFDAKGKPLVNAPNIGSGSKLKVSFETVPYFTAIAGAGLSLRVKAVQLLELREFSSGGNAEAYGFSEEDGYEATVTTTEEHEFTNETEEETEDF
jgi:hypothetical protein